MSHLHLVAGPGNSQHEDQRGVTASEGGQQKAEQLQQPDQADSRNIRSDQINGLVHSYKRRKILASLPTPKSPEDHGSHAK